MNHRSVYLLLGITFSIISAQPTFTEHAISTAADGAESVDAADMDGDGDIDVVSASGVDDKIAWYENDGAQNFTEHVISDTASMVNTIYDLMGRKIKSIINTHQDPGYRLIQWDATNDLGQPVSAGMYIYTIQAGEFRQTKKMVILK